MGSHMMDGTLIYGKIEMTKSYDVEEKTCLSTLMMLEAFKTSAFLN